jgi:hypothetical protein
MPMVAVVRDNYYDQFAGMPISLTGTTVFLLRHGGAILMRRVSTLLVLIAMAAGAGCRTQQLAKDQDQFRHRLLDLYTNQVMDNLVRVDQGLPIVQLDYSKITGTITQNGMGSYTSTQTLMNSKTLVVPTVVRTLMHAFTNTATFNPSAYQTNVLTVTADPVVDHNEVYNAYLEFASQEKSPGRLMKSCDPPPKGSAHFVQKCGDMYYWIPMDFKYEFLRLAMITTVMRGQPLTIPQMFDDTIAKAVYESTSPGPLSTEYRIAVQFATKLKNGPGTLYTGVKNYPPLPLHMYTRPSTGGATGAVVARAGDPTDWFTIIYSDADIKDPPAAFIQSLVNQPVKVDLDFYKPTVPNTDQLIKSLDNNAQLIRMNLQQH